VCLPAEQEENLMMPDVPSPYEYKLMNDFTSAFAYPTKTAKVGNILKLKDREGRFLAGKVGNLMKKRHLIDSVIIPSLHDIMPARQDDQNSSQAVRTRS
jgi:hypothetical protein